MVDKDKVLFNYLYNNKEAWYDITKKHWEKCEGTDKGMLGGNIELHNLDIKASKELIKNYVSKKFLKTNSLLEVGAGIGRVTKSLLVNYFDNIYLVEQDKMFVDTAKKNLNEFKNVKEIIQSPMQKTFENSNLKDLKFSCIWLQWCLENIDDNDLERLLCECKEHLEEKGVIFIKENVVEDNDEVVINDIDYSRVRTDKLYKEIIKKSGLKVFKHMRHPDWDTEFMPVSIYILM